MLRGPLGVKQHGGCMRRREELMLLMLLLLWKQPLLLVHVHPGLAHLRQCPLQRQRPHLHRRQQQHQRWLLQQ